MIAAFEATRSCGNSMASQRGRPAGQCTVCRHPERARAELLLAGKAGYRAVGRKLGINPHALRRHFLNHVSDERRVALIAGPVQLQALAAKVLEESESVLDHHRANRAGIYQMYCAALEAGDRVTGVQIARALKEVDDSIARLTGQLLASPLVQQNNLTVIMESPEVRTFMRELADQLAPFPDAARHVIAWFETKEARTLEAEKRARPALEHQP